MSDFEAGFLCADHRLEAFDCGNALLNSWLLVQARRAQAACTARTYVWTQPGGRDVFAYFAVAPTQVTRTELSRPSLAAGYSVVPAYLLARLALDKTLHGQGLGSQLLLDALERIVQASRIGAGRPIVVDAIDAPAHAFYRHHDFIPVEGSSRLYLKVATAEAVLANRPV